MAADLGKGALIAPENGLSYVRGATDVPLSEATISRFLLDTAGRFPDRPAVVFREQQVRWTWREFAHEVDVLAAGLAALGIVKGDCVGIWSPNRSEWLLTQFATARIGAVLVNINPAYRLAELEYALNKVGCKAVIAAERFKTSAYVEMLQTIAPELASATPGDLHAARVPSLRTIVSMGEAAPAGMFRFADVMARGRDTLDVARLDAIGATLVATEPINIQFTSGTTGSPKGATLTHRNVVNNARSIAAAMRFTEQDSLCIPVPLYHCFGMVLAVLACVSKGAAMVFPGEAFDPVATLAAVADERCTALHGVPTMFIAELDHPDFAKFDLSTLRTGIMAGSPCPIETMKRVVSQMHLREITIAYGMTETSPVSFQSSTDDPLEKRTTTVGRIQPHLEVKIVDPNGEIVPVGATGELCTKGYSVMLGYWDDDAKTREVLVDGWMHTGDLATLDADGYCNIVGRLKDMVIRGGENVYPREIEEFLFRHPKIQSAQVFGVPDPKYGEELCAWIVLRADEQMTEDDVRAFCSGQIAHYKIPRYIRFVDELPMTVTGKVQKFVMRDRMIEELKLNVQKTA
ncbi:MULTISPECIES: AMP-binding protein [unclassified Burkholderia]|uniref:AMP-binding protein n=1 Tax=unclassified Burkholderia TaxID=2613784 RepID=UPI000F579142|nr:MULTISPECIES: AMP-binding protein [unclassified Burkholderia]RQR43786.1 AMP-binding protein [Burkholderia sp. Bp9131]RQR75831.1 AMP-binding protein [Burkholderia sp. Bp9015]RQR97406.1 AMP-binding protein [Burkholderia sp. Bp8994]RQS32259.1 AMP-binding protein [Burkholderia sp. Bp8995]RQS39411.1 AMP-binding protein [Burkholderia sp. Bp8990]